MDSATTSFTSGSSVVSNFSIPSFKVTVDEGQPEQEPLNSTVTTPSLKETKSIAPPSLSTAGFTYSVRMALMALSYSLGSTAFFSVLSLGFWG